jgi:SAM-dependent methyltransferase
MDDTKTLYRARFSPSEQAVKERVWAVLCEEFFSRYVSADDRVLDVGAGYCEFINNITCREKYAIDMNPDTASFARPDVRVTLASCLDMSSLPAGYFDVVFVSNFFEHLESKREMNQVLEQIHTRLRESGKLLVLQPNIRYLGPRYWDFYDHSIPLTDLSLREALEMNGYAVKQVIPRFLPYTTKSWIPKSRLMVRAYLRFPLGRWILGRQTFVMAVKVRAA